MDLDFAKIKPLTRNPKPVWELAYDDFNCVGMVSNAFEIDGRADDLILEAVEDGCDLIQVWQDGPYRICELDDFEPIPTMVLLKGNVAAGFNMCGQLWIDEDHRGRGLSIPLVLAVAARRGGEATPSELLGFSHAGAAAHEAAWRAAVLLALEQGKDVPPTVVKDYLERGGLPPNSNKIPAP